MLKLLIFSLFLVLAFQAKSGKKGLCIPPGTNFHCRDLSAFTDARYKNCFSFMK